MKPFALHDNLYWIGALHPDLRVFDIIMQTKNGSTYNSYLIKDEKIAVIDTVKEKFADQYIAHVAELVDPQKIDYIVVQHTEPDHSGSLSKLLMAAPKAEVVCSKAAVKYVQKILNRDVNIRPIGPREELTLGARSLTFFPAPYIHWPDTMMTYLAKDQLLFSCDLFGAHFCDSRMYDDLITRDIWPDFKYYFDCIMRPFKKNVRNALEKLDNLEITQIAPSHGPIIRRDVQKYIAAYRQWSAPPAPNSPPKMLIYFASAHGNTELMAHTIAEGARSVGAEVQVFDAQYLAMDEHVEKIEAADALLLGSPTINNDAVKPVWDVLNSLVTIDVKGKLAGCFGSYAWSGDAVELLKNRLLAMKFKVPFEGRPAVLTPNAEELKGCFDYGVQLAELLSSNSQ